MTKLTGCTENLKGASELLPGEVSYQPLRRPIDDPARNFAQIRTIIVCQSCDGKGCRECRGTGRIKRNPIDPRVAHRLKMRAEYQEEINSLRAILDTLFKGSARADNIRGEIVILQNKMLRL